MGVLHTIASLFIVCIFWSFILCCLSVWTYYGDLGVLLGTFSSTVSTQHRPPFLSTDRVGGDWQRYWVGLWPLHGPPSACPLRYFISAHTLGRVARHSNAMTNSPCHRVCVSPSLLALPLLSLQLPPSTAMSGGLWCMRGSLWASCHRHLPLGGDVILAGMQLYTAASSLFIRACWSMGVYTPITVSACANWILKVKTISKAAGHHLFYV